MYTVKWRVAALIVVVAFATAGCRAWTDLRNIQNQGAPTGRLLLWHTWTGDAAGVLDELIAAYVDLHPGTQIVTTAVDEEKLLDAVVESSATGLGPDLLLVDAATLSDLKAAELIREIRDDDLDFSQLLSNAFRMVADDHGIYGMPFAGHTQVLFYNRDTVEESPENVWAWLERAKLGERYALNPGLEESYWGIGAYGGSIMHEESDELVLRQGGYKSWLEALQLARTYQNILLDDDSTVLRDAFIAGNVDLYFGNSSEVPELRAALGEDVLGVAMLPEGPSGLPARPLLGLSIFAFTHVSSDSEHALAQDLVDFLSDSEAQLSVAWADIGQAPVNSHVPVNTGVPERTRVVAQQIRRAYGLHFARQGLWRDLQNSVIDDVGSQRAVVEGLATTDQMIDHIAHVLTEQYAFTEAVIDPGAFCAGNSADVLVWHSFQGAEAEAFDAVAGTYERRCTGNQVELVYIPADEIYQRYVEAFDAGGGPELLYTTSSWLPTLAEQGAIQDLTETFPLEQLQQFQPRAVSLMRIDDRLFGIPESMSPLALYYNTDLVVDPPQYLQSVLQSVDIDHRFLLPVGFYQGYWGMNLFGRFVWDGERGEILDASGLVDWLQWVQAADKRPGVDVVFDWREGEQVFIDGKAAYYVGGPWSLSRIRHALGDDGFRVVPLPGVSAPGQPLLQVTGAMLNANANHKETDSALSFARFVTLHESQQRLLETKQHVTASVTHDLSGLPNINGFWQQSSLAAIDAEDAAFNRMRMLGDELYRAVLIDQEDVTTAVERFVEEVNGADRQSGELSTDSTRDSPE